MKSFVAVVAVSAGLVAAACGKPAPSRPAQAPSVAADVTTADSRQIPQTFEGGGVVRGRLTASIASRLLAPVVEVRVRPGDRVGAGQVLLTLDARELQEQASRSAAALAAARQTVRAADSEKLGADAALTLATASFGRVSGLHGKGSATNQELDEATAALDAARARATAVQAHAAEAASALTAAEAGSNAAAISASYAVVTAPFAGRVTERFVDPGAMAAPGAVLLTVEDTAAYRLEVSLDEARAGQVAVGQSARFLLDGGQDGAWAEGRISEISRIDPSRHSFVIKIDIPRSVNARPGAFGRASFAAGARPAVTAPASALIRRGQMTFVFAVDGDSVAHLRPIMTGASVDDRVEVLSGLSHGDRVVANPAPSMTDGTRVTSRGGR